MFPLPPSAPVGTPGGAALEGAGLDQIGRSAMQASFEISQACMQLAKMVPVMAPLLGQFVSDMKLQLGSALSASQTAVLGGPDQAFPDGSARLSAY